MFSSDRCVRAKLPGAQALYFDGRRLLKDLAKLKSKTGWPLSRMIAIDDNPSFFQRQYSNLLAVEPFEGEESQLAIFLALHAELDRLQALEDVRPVEKRNWFARWARVECTPITSNSGPAL